MKSLVALCCILVAGFYLPACDATIQITKVERTVFESTLTFRVDFDITGDFGVNWFTSLGKNITEVGTKAKDQTGSSRYTKVNVGIAEVRTTISVNIGNFFRSVSLTLNTEATDASTNNVNLASLTITGYNGDTIADGHLAYDISKPLAYFKVQHPELKEKETNVDPFVTYPLYAYGRQYEYYEAMTDTFANLQVFKVDESESTKMETVVKAIHMRSDLAATFVYRQNFGLDQLIRVAEVTTSITLSPSSSPSGAVFSNEAGTQVFKLMAMTSTTMYYCELPKRCEVICEVWSSESNFAAVLTNENEGELARVYNLPGERTAKISYVPTPRNIEEIRANNKYFCKAFDANGEKDKRTIKIRFQTMTVISNITAKATASGGYEATALVTAFPAITSITFTYKLTGCTAEKTLTYSDGVSLDWGIYKFKSEIFASEAKGMTLDSVHVSVQGSIFGSNEAAEYFL